MVDEEVETILSEIRERVRARELPSSAIGNPAPENANESFGIAAASRRAETSAAEVLARLDSYLAVTSRAWDRLPPVVSNRSGSVARLELWIKRHSKRATRWFAWEQVNFNAAVHHALRDILQALSVYQQALAELRSEMEGQRAMIVMIEQGQQEFKAQREQFAAERAEFKAQRAEFKAQRAELESRLESQRANSEAQHTAQVVAQGKEMEARLSSLAHQMNERLDQMREEQRVCFKQLSLEATEAAVLEDRARRKAESLMEELGNRMGHLEKVKSKK